MSAFKEKPWPKDHTLAVEGLLKTAETLKSKVALVEQRLQKRITEETLN